MRWTSELERSNFGDKIQVDETKILRVYIQAVFSALEASQTTDELVSRADFIDKSDRICTFLIKLLSHQPIRTKELRSFREKMK